MIEFTNEAELVDWLNSRDPRDVICFRTREALRTLPDLGSRDWSNHTPEEAAKGSQKHLIPIRTLALPVMRAILIGAVGSLGSTTELRELASDAGILSGLDAHEFSERFFYAAEVAQHAAFLVATGTAPRPAVRAFSTFLGLSQSTEEALHVSSIDADKIENAEFISEVFDMSLWPENGMPPKLAVNLKGLRDFFKSDPKVWGFWERWYDGFLSGNPIEWEVQLAIAELPNDDWGKGPEWIAEKIDAIQRDLLSKRAPLSERLVFGDATAKFHAVPMPLAKPDLIAATLQQVGDTLADALENPSNGLHDKSRETRVIRRILDKYAEDPQQIELNLVSVAIGLRRQIHDTKELPDSEENLALLATVEDGARAIRATHPDVAENRTILAQQSLAELTEDDKDLLIAAKEPLMLLSEWQVADDFDNDIDELVAFTPDPSGNFAPPMPEVVRTFHRVAEMGKAMEKPGVLDRIEENKTYRGIRIVGVTGGLAMLIGKIIEIGLRLFGIL